MATRGDRPLTRLADFERFTGFKAKAETRHLIDGRRRFSGIIAGVEGNQIVLRTEDGEPESNDEARLNFGDLAKAKLVAKMFRVAACEGSESGVSTKKDTTD